MASITYEADLCEHLNGAAQPHMRNARMAEMYTPAWLKVELTKNGRSQSALARSMGLDTATVNRMCAGTRQIKAAELPLIDKYLADTGGATIQPQSLTYVKVLGAVEAGAWREPGLEDGGEPLPVIVTDNDAGLYALRVVGPSMNLRYEEGTCVIVRPWAGGPWPVGKRVVVQRTDSSGKVETTLKELVAGDDGLELWPRSSDQRFQDPIPFKNGDDVVQIIGQVVSTWRSED